MSENNSKAPMWKPKNQCRGACTQTQQTRLKLQSALLDLQEGGTFLGTLYVKSHSRKAGTLAKPLNPAVYGADGREGREADTGNTSLAEQW